MANRLKSTQRERAVVIVAHPDDETIWMGGFILDNPDYNWTILSLCRASDSDRAPKFKRVADHYGATGIIEDADDEDKLDYYGKVKEIERIITKHFAKQEIDLLFTHGKNGEYGHKGHTATHEAITNLLKTKKITAKKILCFNYVKTSRKQFCKLKPAANSDKIAKLSKKTFANKTAIMTDIYGFAADGIDTGYCTNPEAFKILK
jgi:LmbE family N-acetylglucosaminyl deacetylase